MALWGVSGGELLAELRAVALELGLLAADAVLCASLAAAVRASGRAMARLRDAPCFEAGPALCDTVTACGGRLEYAAVRGAVRPLATAIRSRADPAASGVLQRLSLQEYTMEASGATGFWSERRRTVREVLNAVPFALCGDGLQVALQDPAALTIVDLYTVRDEYVPAEASLAQSVWQWLLGERKQGLRDVEEMLLDGTRVTGYGELVRTERGLELRSPPGELPYILTTRSEAALLRAMEADRSAARAVLLVLAAAGACGAAWTGRRLWRALAARARRRRLAAEYEAIRTERRRRERPGAAVPEPVQCVVCLTNPREVVVAPCQHVCLCVDCEERLQKRACPVCRREVTGVLPVYLA